jgi:predicted heme/steroid binding protein/uncharacterized membrane protein
MKEIDTEALSKENGEIGKSVYVACGGKVFDLSESKLWKGGVHMQRHHAGADLTTDIQAAPHGTDILERYPQVAVLKGEATTGREMPQALSRLLERFPVLRRHPHPMTVHFPIVFTFAAAVFTLFFLATGSQGFEITALNCLAANLIFAPVAMATGYYTWWLNYMARPMRAVNIKKRLAIILLCINIVVFIWRIVVPDILAPFTAFSAIYLVLVIAMFILVSVVGWLGATLTFPVEKQSHRLRGQKS